MGKNLSNEMASRINTHNKKVNKQHEIEKRKAEWRNKHIGPTIACVIYIILITLFIIAAIGQPLFWIGVAFIAPILVGTAIATFTSYNQGYPSAEKDRDELRQLNESVEQLKKSPHPMGKLGAGNDSHQPTTRDVVMGVVVDEDFEANSYMSYFQQPNDTTKAEKIDQTAPTKKVD
jgi:hypothetical protein